MGWYTDSAVWNLPVWFSDIWLISNFTAVGFLIMTIWLAMYAAIAARSIGTRLLTSYARLSIPTKKQIDDIKQPLFWNTKDAVEKGLAAYQKQTDEGEIAV